VRGRENKFLNIFLGFKLIKSCNKYLETAKADILSNPFFNWEESTCNSLGNFGSSIGFTKLSSNLKYARYSQLLGYVLNFNNFVCDISFLSSNVLFQFAISVLQSNSSTINFYFQLIFIYEINLYMNSYI